MAKNNTDKAVELGQISDDNEIGPDVTGIDRLWFASAGLVLAVAAFLRFFWLELKPLHHDEGVNGHFLTTLFKEGVYHYDPQNYHGPDLYYLSLAFTKVFGLNTLSIRWSVAIFGFLTVVLSLYLKKYIGKIGALAAALFLALSPGMVYVSRYFIHEILFVFLSLAIVVAVLMFWHQKKAGIGAVIWMTLLAALCFLPVSLIAAGAVGGKNIYLVWGLRIGVFLVESILIFFVIRMLIQWHGGRPIYLILASASAVLLYATKETAFITHGTMLIAIGCVYVWSLIQKKVPDELQKKKIVIGLSALGLLTAAVIGGLYRSDLYGFYEWFYAIFAGAQNQIWLFYLIVFSIVIAVIAYGVFILDIGKSKPDYAIDEPRGMAFSGDWTGADRILTIAACTFVFGYLLLLFFTSFFSFPKDITNFFAAYALWAKTGSTDHTQNGVFGYVKWMMQIESPIVILSVLGTLYAVIIGKHKFALFAGLWSFGLFLAYTIISYKTPWLALSFTLPMCIAGGYALNVLLESKETINKGIGYVLAIAAVVILSFQTYDLNFVRYDDESMPYVYAHTRREFEDLVRDAKRYADKSSKKKDSTIDVVSDEYWPMPWYFKDYPNALFHGKLVPASTSEIVIAHEKQLPELPEMYSRNYKYIGTYPLRPGVDLYLLVRNDLAGEKGKNIYDIE